MVEDYVLVPQLETRNTFLNFSKHSTTTLRRRASAPDLGRASALPSKKDHAVIFEALARNKEALARNEQTVTATLREMQTQMDEKIAAMDQTVHEKSRRAAAGRAELLANSGRRGMGRLPRKCKLRGPCRDPVGFAYFSPGPPIFGKFI